MLMTFQTEQEADTTDLACDMVDIAMTKTLQLQRILRRQQICAGPA